MLKILDGVLLVFNCEPEVDDLDFSQVLVTTDENVPWLHIPVDDILLFVQIGESAENAFHDHRALRLAQRLSFLPSPVVESV